MTLEADVRYRIVRTLENKGWVLNPDDPLRNLYFESSMPQGYSKKLGRKRPDYTLLYKEHVDDSYIPLGVIEAKKPVIKTIRKSNGNNNCRRREKIIDAGHRIFFNKMNK